MSKNHTVLAAALAFSVLMAGPAAADIAITKSSAVQGANVLFNSGVQTGAAVTGHTQGGVIVDFSGSTVGGGNVIRANGGQARIEGALNTSTPAKNDTLLLSSLSFALADGSTFNNVEFNLFGGNATGVNFAVTDNLGAIFNFSSVFGNGAEKFAFVGTGGQSIRSISLSLVGGGIEDVRQIRLDQVVAGVVPEPATWALMILGFGAIGGALRRTKKPRTIVRFA